MRVGVKQGIMQGITVGTTNCVFLCSYALALWYGSTRVRAGKYDGRPPLASTPLDCMATNMRSIHSGVQKAVMVCCARLECVGSEALARQVHPA